MPKITEIYAYIAQDNGPDDEGIAAHNAPGMGWMPMIGADKERIESLEGWAKAVKDITGRPVRLVRFTLAEEMGEV